MDDNSQALRGIITPVIEGRIIAGLVVLLALAPVPIFYGLSRRGLDAVFEADRAARGDRALAVFSNGLVARIDAAVDSTIDLRLDDPASYAVSDASLEHPLTRERFQTAREFQRSGEESDGLDALEMLRPRSEDSPDERLVSYWLSSRVLAALAREDLAQQAREKMSAIEAADLSVAASRFRDVVLEGEVAARRSALAAWIDEVSQRATDLGELAWIGAISEPPDLERARRIARRAEDAARLRAATRELQKEQRAIATIGSTVYAVGAPSRTARAIDLATFLEPLGARVGPGEGEWVAVPARLEDERLRVEFGGLKFFVRLAGGGPFPSIDPYLVLDVGAALYVLLVSLVGWGLFRSVSRAHALATTRSDLIAQITHELRTPLAILRMYGETLAARRVPESSRDEYVETMSREATRLGLLVDRVARVARDERELDESAVSADGEGGTSRALEVVSALTTTWARAIADVGGTIATRFEDDSEVAIQAEDLRLVLDVLLDNAVHYGSRESASPVIEVAMTRSARTLSIRVRDHGPGIALEDRARLFERFTRGAVGKRSSHRGAGMGLFLARRVARAAGGDLILEFPGDGGVCARIDLPAVEESVEEGAAS